MENQNQFYSITETEMLNLWKQIMHFDTPLRDCTVEWDDGINLDALMLTHIKQWYAHQLLSAPFHLLPIDDVAQLVTLSISDNVVTAIVPPQCVRPVEWKLAEWHRSVTEFLIPDSLEAKCQFNKWTRGGAFNPAIIDYGNKMLLMSSNNSNPQLEIARCVVRPVDGSYQFHSELLNTIPQWEQSMPQLM